MISLRSSAGNRPPPQPILARRESTESGMEGAETYKAFLDPTLIAGVFAPRPWPENPAQPKRTIADNRAMAWRIIVRIPCGSGLLCLPERMPHRRRRPLRALPGFRIGFPAGPDGRNGRGGF